MCAVTPYTLVMLCSRAGLRDYDYGIVRVRSPLLRQICSHIPYNIDRAWVWALFTFWKREFPTMQSGSAPNLQSSCCSLLSVRIKGIHYHAQEYAFLHVYGHIQVL